MICRTLKQYEVWYWQNKANEHLLVKVGGKTTCMRLGILGNFSIWAGQILANVPLRVWDSVNKWSVCCSLHRAAEKLQYGICIPCLFICNGLVCVLKNITSESSFPELLKPGSCDVQSKERSLPWKMGGRSSDPSSSGTTSVHFTWNVHFENVAGKQFLFKGTV